MHTTQTTKPTMWTGWVQFAGYMMMVAGIFDLIAGFTALFKDTVFIVTNTRLVALDYTGWGIVHIILGVIMFVAGVALLGGKTWARVLAVIMAVLSAIANFAFIDAYPWWSLAIIIVDVVVIYAVIVHGGELRE